MITTIKNNSLVDFEYELSLILNSNSNEVEKAKKIIIFIEDILKQITDWLKNHVFESIQEEIKFFKEIKPNIVAKLIFYKEILVIVATLPLDKNKRVKHYEKRRYAKILDKKISEDMQILKAKFNANTQTQSKSVNC